MFSLLDWTYYYSLNLHHLVTAFGLGNVIATGFTIFIVVVNVIVYTLREFSEGNDGGLEDKSTPSTSPTEQLCRRFSLAMIRSATQDFNEGLVIGRGGFGKVYKGFINNGQEVVAIKRLSSGSKQGEDEFWMEIETLSRLRHLHLVSLIGYCNEGNEKIPIYEYMPGGALVDHLYKTKGVDHTPLSWEKRLKICIGAARGLDYLHTGTAPGVIHRDVKDANILLNGKLVAKIADFGLAKLENIDQLPSYVSTNVKGTFGYMDPEYFLTRRVSKKTDVYAFGVVLLVVLSGRPAVDMTVEEGQQSLVLWTKKCIEEGRVDEIIDPRLKLEIQSNNSLEEFIKVVENCLHKQPKERPSMAQVVANLELAWEHQQLALSSTMPLEVNAPFVDATSPKSEQSQNGSGTPHKSAWAWLWEGFQKNENSKSQNIISSEPTIRIFSFLELKKATKNFRHDHLIGEGSGNIYKGWIFRTGSSNKRSRSLVSVNRQNSEGYLKFDELQVQVHLLGTLAHPNIVNFMGYCRENDEFLYVHEFMKKGSMDKYLYRKSSAGLPLSWDLRLKICSDAARGLAFLHSLDMPMIHRDFQSSKILLDDSFNAKVIGFRLGRYAPTGSETHVSTRFMGTSGCRIAPEYCRTGHLNVKSDDYSFGIVLLETLTGRRLTDALHLERKRSVIDWTDAYLFSDIKFKSIMDSRLEGQYHPGALKPMAQLTAKCVSAEPKMRPSMREVVETLEHIQSINQET